jgi:hypothetical protein
MEQPDRETGPALMSRSRLDCRACGHRMGHLNPSGTLHASDGVRRIEPDRDHLLVTLSCPSCGHTFTVRASRIAMTGTAT